MRFLILMMLIVVGAAFAVDPRETGTFATGNYSVPPAGTDDFTISVLNTFECSYAGMILGLDYVDASEYLLFIDNTDGAEKLWVSGPDGSEVNSFALPWDTPDPFGVADFYTMGNIPHVNDFSDTFIYYTLSFDVWYENPYEMNGRGMDCDGTYIWEAYGPLSASYGAACRFLPDGTLLGAWNLPGIGTQLAGLTTFPISGSLGIAVTPYDSGASDHYIWFFEFTGSGFTFLGSAMLPTCNTSFGLAYSGSRGTYFWSYIDGSTYHVSELSVTESALQQSTWGAIKTSF